MHTFAAKYRQVHESKKTNHICLILVEILSSVHATRISKCFFTHGLRLCHIESVSDQYMWVGTISFGQRIAISIVKKRRFGLETEFCKNSFLLFDQFNVIVGHCQIKNT